ncbi:MAG TPA: FHA domain-containing protein [Thermoanaerobaculia bacterium]|jgi:hypothetical protein
MDDAGWHYRGADEHGFVAYEELSRLARKSSREEFLRRFPVPALLVVYRDTDTPAEPLDPSSNAGVQLLTMSIKSAAILSYLNRLAFLCKRPGNPFAHLISIGRSVSNDIAIAVDSVSKVHGYFARQGEGWGFTDHGSTNGSLLNDQPLKAGATVALKDGDFLQLGLEVSLEYLSPGRLYERVASR